MKIEDSLKNDKRFYIDDFTFETHLKISKMLSYDIVELELGKILRQQDNKIFPMKYSDVYKYLEGASNNIEEYNKYCENILIGEDRKKHSTKIYDQLIKNISKNDYDIRKGIIVVNQLNIIMDGQHRACILLKKYGENHKIKVLKVRYSYLGIRTYLNYLKYKIRK